MKSILTTYIRSYELNELVNDNLPEFAPYNCVESEEFFDGSDHIYHILNSDEYAYKNDLDIECLLYELCKIGLIPWGRICVEVCWSKSDSKKFRVDHAKFLKREELI